MQDGITFVVMRNVIYNEALLTFDIGPVFMAISQLYLT